MGDVGTGSFFLEKKGFTVLLNSEADLIKLHQFSHGGSVANHGGGTVNNNDNTTNRLENHPMQRNAGQPG